MVKFLLFIFFILVLTIPNHVYAISDPLAVPNNKFGIHIIDENDLDDAARLVNSSGGTWGYVAIVIREDDRNVEKWQNVFDKMRRLQLIPIVRLATKMENDYWTTPREADIGSWVDFLDKLNWVVKNRYVIIFNEPNHAQEWGGKIDPEEYVKFLKLFSEKLKAKNQDFFILPAGFDASAPNDVDTMDEIQFLNKAVNYDPNFFKYIDGWTSHSYPNPGFVGSPLAFGRGTVKTYLWEMYQIQQMGAPNLPIFITETGWKHAMGRQIINALPSPDFIAQNFVSAYTNAWNNYQIVVVAPFLLNYQDAPFDHFSFRKLDSHDFYPMFDTIQLLPKNKGEPVQIHQAQIYADMLPTSLIKNSEYNLYFEIENHGQSIISNTNDFTVKTEGLTVDFDLQVVNLENIEPKEKRKVFIKIKTGDELKIYNFKLQLFHKQDKITEKDIAIALVPPPSLTLFTKTLFNHPLNNTEAKLIIYDHDQKVIAEYNHLKFNQGYAQVKDLYNLVPYEMYRLVLIKPYYLPRQILVKISAQDTGIEFPLLLPFDFNNDQKFTLNDLFQIILHPIASYQTIFP